MTHTANYLAPAQGKFRRALAAMWAFLQAMETTGFDYTARSRRTLGTGGKTIEGGIAPNPRASSCRCSYCQQRFGRTLSRRLVPPRLNAPTSTSGWRLRH